MKLVLLVALFCQLSYGASTLSVSTVNLGTPRHGRKVVATWVAHTDGTFGATEIQLGGLVAKVVTNPGSTAPTTLYDIACGDPSDTGLDVFSSTLINRHTTNTEQVYPVATSATMPVYASSCTLQITGNIVNGAGGTIEFYVLLP